MIIRQALPHRTAHEIPIKTDAHHLALYAPLRPVFSRQDLHPKVGIGIFVGEPIGRQTHQEPGDLIIGGPPLPQATHDLALGASTGHRKAQGGLPQAFECRDVLNLGNPGIVHLLPRRQTEVGNQMHGKPEPLGPILLNADRTPIGRAAERRDDAHAGNRIRPRGPPRWCSACNATLEPCDRGRWRLPHPDRGYA